MTSSMNTQSVLENLPNWSLAGDAKLLELMESISQNLEQRCLETNSKLNQMLLSSEETNINLGNITNKLLSLQHSQFVENRVCEDDSEVIHKTEMKSNIAKSEEEISALSAIEIAVNNGVKMLNTCYEKLSLNIVDSDNDDEEDDINTTSIAFRPKDPYIEQPIPYIIGSKEWKEKWHIGLVESDGESEEDVKLNEYSDSSSSESLAVSIPSNAQTMSESEGSVWGLNTNNTNTTASSKNLFKDDESSNGEDNGKLLENNLIKSHEKIIPNSSILSENKSDDVKNMNYKPVKVPVLPVNSIFPQSQQHQQNQQRKTINLFDDEPPEFDKVDHNPIQPNKRLNLFESDDENDDFDDLFPSVSNKTKSTMNSFNDKPPEIKRTIEKIDDENVSKSSIPIEVDNSQSKSNKISNSDILNKTEPVNQNKFKINNLFDDDNDEFDDNVKIETPKPSETKPSEPLNQKKFKISNLFDDDDLPEDDLDIFIKFKKDSLEKNKTVTKPSKLTNLFDDDDDVDDDLFKTKKPIVENNQISDILNDKPDMIVPDPKVPSVNVNTIQSDKEILIANEEEEDDWIVKPSSSNIFDKFKENSNLESEIVKPIQNVIIFSDTPPDDVEKIIPEPEPTKKLSNIYYDDTKSFPSLELSKDEDVTDDSLKINGNNVKKKLDLFTNFAEIKSKEEIGNSENINRPQIKKLNTNLKINVSALLPGQRPKLNRETSEKSSSSSFEECENKEDINSQPKIIAIDQESPIDNSILPNLNKNRVKIQTKRKPSTRKARHENYRKSLIDDENENVNDEKEINDEVPTQNITNDKEEKEKPASIFDSDDNVPDVDMIKPKPLPRNEEIGIGKSLFFNDEIPPVDDIIPQINPKDSMPKINQSNIDNLFEQPPPLLEDNLSDYGDDDLFNNENSSYFPRESNRLGNNSLFDDELPPSLYSINVDEKKKTENPKINLFDDLEEPDDDDDLFKTIKSKSNNENSEITKPSISSLFQDMDDKIKNESNSKLFNETNESLFKTTNQLEKITENFNSTNEKKSIKFNLFGDEDVDDQPILDDLKKSNDNRIIKSKSIFDDDDEDGSDIFNTSKINQTKDLTTKSITTKVMPTSSSSSKLFESDDDDDDGIFGKSNTSTIKSGLKFLKSNTNNKKSLFDDNEDTDDDTDDLFKVKSTIIPKNIKTTTQIKSKSIVAVENITDDPLSDLIK